jgi:hypothetical protein
MVRKERARARSLFVCLLFTVLLSSCVGADGLMQAPRPAVQYQRLQNRIDTLLASGYNYSAPVTGDIRHAVTMADLSGSGSQEAVVFLRSETEAMLAVFSPGGGEFTLLPPVTEDAESVHSAAFIDLDGDGRQEIIVGWQVGSLRALSVYSLEDGGLTEIFRSPSFSAYTVYSTDDSGTPALLIARVDSSEQVVDMVTYRDGELRLVSTAFLSRGAETVRRIRTGPLLDGKPGLYVTSQYQTAAGEVTDILTFSGGELVNISVNMETGISEALVRHREIAAYDIDGSGVLSLPRQVALARHPAEGEEGETFFEIHWNAYDSGGLSVETARTYHSPANNWYILLPEKWPKSHEYTVRRESNATVFSEITNTGDPADFLSIFYSTQTANDRNPVRDRTVLIEQDNLLVTAEIVPLKNDPARFYISEPELKALFNFIPVDWRLP